MNESLFHFFRNKSALTAACGASKTPGAVTLWAIDTSCPACTEVLSSESAGWHFEHRLLPKTTKTLCGIDWAETPNIVCNYQDVGVFLNGTRGGGPCQACSRLVYGNEETHSNSDRTPEYRGRFHYLGGHPDVEKVPASLKTEVVVDGERLRYLRKATGNNKFQEVFAIELDEISEVRHPATQLVEFYLERDGQRFNVRFRAIGIRQQKDCFDFFAALQSHKDPSMIRPRIELEMGTVKGSFDYMGGWPQAHSKGIRALNTCSVHVDRERITVSGGVWKRKAFEIPMLVVKAVRAKHKPGSGLAAMMISVEVEVEVEVEGRLLTVYLESADEKAANHLQMVINQLRLVVD